MAIVASVRIVVLCLAVVFASTAARAQSPFETPPVLKAQDLAPPGLLSGPRYRVDGRVPTTGLLGEFSLQSDVGEFKPHGLDLLRIRVAELAAIEQLDKTSKTEEFLKAAGKAAVRPVVAAGNMLLHPVETISSMPASVGRFFERVKLGGEFVVAAASAPGKSAGDKTADVTRRVGSVTVDALGYEEERRNLAKRLNVDPYTTNPVLSEKMTDVAWVTFSSRETVALAGAILNPFSMLLSTVSLTNNLVWDMKTADLIALNEKKLNEMGASEEQARALLTNRWYSLSVLTSFVTGLERLAPVAGRPDAIALATTAASEDQARFLAGSIQMLAHHHEWVSRLSLVTAQSTIVGRTAAGGVIVGAPVDYVSWTEPISNFARGQHLKASEADLWITGKMSPRAKREFEALGWRVHEGTSTATAQ